jgi:hypothetical protein
MLFSRCSRSTVSMLWFISEILSAVLCSVSDHFCVYSRSITSIINYATLRFEFLHFSILFSFFAVVARARVCAYKKRLPALLWYRHDKRMRMLEVDFLFLKNTCVCDCVSCFLLIVADHIQ